jgi:hypothetical protein
MIMQRANVAKVAMMGLMLVGCSMQASSQKINWGNAIKFGCLSGTSLMGAKIYYDNIIKPYIIKLAQEEGLGYMIKFNKDFVMQCPELALLYATPLLISIFHAILARDYAQKIWQNNKKTNEETEQELVIQQN